MARRHASGTYRRLRRKLLHEYEYKNFIHCPICKCVLMYPRLLRRKLNTSIPEPKSLATIDHILPWQKGHKFTNLTLMCKACNEDKGNRTPIEWISYRKHTGREFSSETKQYLEALYNRALEG